MSQSHNYIAVVTHHPTNTLPARVHTGATRMIMVYTDV
jgi:hypothetical protein